MIQNRTATLAGRRALVTGGAQRIGREIALGLARAGCDVIVHYCTSKTEAANIVSEITDLGQRARSIACDFRVSASISDFARLVCATWGGLEILINNASSFPSPNQIIANSDLLCETEQDWDLALDVNAKAPYLLTKHLAPALGANHVGNIINILDSSVSSPYFSRPAHTVSKVALASLTKISARALAPDIRVNALELGAILPGTAMPESERSKRRWGTVTDVVSTLIHILETEFIDGTIIKIDGGQDVNC